ncbi:hypothetical protein B0T16DRAFT_463205 [Cercophora newfieldiana]|uniref:Uncharacterized protein n=1 Tax=Cercophora newfieldiana TaxID=92897 RepID=A0AA39XSQ6_9PEZI|nr:hypothetical protein B0T16DRAFT_463205 [Cercophora newfieldiana]
MHLPLFIHPVALAAPIDPGYWNITRRHGSSAQGHRYTELLSTYSGTPNMTVLCSWRYDPSTRLESHECNATNFSYDWGPGPQWSNDITLWQTVPMTVDGVAKHVNIAGTGPVDYKCGGVNGRLCEGSGRINATIVKENGVEKA